jgi:predicted RNA binding protein YcfA (HicA-like mRNA interferase family)
MRKFPSVKAKILYRVLTTEPINYILKKQKGSHRKLVCEGRKTINFSWHDKVEISGWKVKELLIDFAGLNETSAWEVLHWRKF